jgi:hypothetical protein
MSFQTPLQLILSAACANTARTPALSIVASTALHNATAADDENLKRSKRSDDTTSTTVAGGTARSVSPSDRPETAVGPSSSSAAPLTPTVENRSTGPRVSIADVKGAAGSEGGFGGGVVEPLPQRGGAFTALDVNSFWRMQLESSLQQHGHRAASLAKRQAPMTTSVALPGIKQHQSRGSVYDVVRPTAATPSPSPSASMGASIESRRARSVLDASSDDDDDHDVKSQSKKRKRGKRGSSSTRGRSTSVSHRRRATSQFSYDELVTRREVAPLATQVIQGKEATDVARNGNQFWQNRKRMLEREAAAAEAALRHEQQELIRAAEEATMHQLEAARLERNVRDAERRREAEAAAAQRKVEEIQQRHEQHRAVMREVRAGVLRNRAQICEAVREERRALRTTRYELHAADQERRQRLHGSVTVARDTAQSRQAEKIHADRRTVTEQYADRVTAMEGERRVLEASTAAAVDECRELVDRIQDLQAASGAMQSRRRAAAQLRHAAVRQQEALLH